MDAFIGCLKLVAFPQVPAGWASCNGQSMPIAQNQALYSLLGTTYGGNGVSSFNLPDLQGRTPVHAGQRPTDGQPFTMGQAGGSTRVTLTQQNLPAHSHQVGAVAAVPGGGPSTGNHFAAWTTNVYAGTADTTFAAGAVDAGPGTAQPIDIRQPYLAMNYIISLNGIYPSRG